VKKGCVIGLGITGILSLALCAGLIGLFVYWIVALTRPVVDASEEFLSLLGQGKIAEAYAGTASGFRAQQDEASFTAAVKQLGLTDYSSVSWQNRQIKNQSGLAQGTVTTSKGTTMPVVIEVVNENGTWKVVAVQCGGVDLKTIKAPVQPPSGN
jgi:hypothetical protein